jgi:hypothetical protein
MTLSLSDQVVGKDATYKTQKKYKRKTPMASVGFETTIPEIDKPHTFALDFKATGIGLCLIYLSINVYETRS